MIVLKDLTCCFSKRFSTWYAENHPEGEEEPSPVKGSQLQPRAETSPSFILLVYLLYRLMTQKDLKPLCLSISEVKHWACSLAVTSRKFGTFLKKDWPQVPFSDVFGLRQTWHSRGLWYSQHSPTVIVCHGSAQMKVCSAEGRSAAAGLPAD